MKKTANEINNILQSDNFQNIENLRLQVSKFGWADREYNEMNMNEAIIKFEEIISILKNIIQKDIFEEIIVYHERNDIYLNLQNINSDISHIVSGNDYISKFIQNIQNILRILNQYRIELKIDGYPEYQKKKSDITYLIKRYKELIDLLDNAGELNEEAIDILNNIKENNNEISNNYNESQNQLNKITSIKDDVVKLHEEMKVSNKNVTEYESNIKVKNKDITNFFDKINDYDTKINEGLNNLAETLKKKEEEVTDFVSEKNKLFGELIKEKKNDTDEIIEKNKELQSDIIDILSKAIGTNLYKSFNSKGNWLFREMIFRFIIICVSIIFAVILGKDILEQLQPFFTSGTIDNLSISFFLRLTLLFPALYALYFSSSQFNITVKLKEEYDFKSAVAVALHYFKDLVEDSQELEDKKFVINSIDKIFESPTEKIFGKKISEKEIRNNVKDVAGSVADIAGKVYKK